LADDYFKKLSLLGVIWKKDAQSPTRQLISDDKSG
jgi:hypothetical protein